MLGRQIVELRVAACVGTEGNAGSSKLADLVPRKVRLAAQTGRAVGDVVGRQENRGRETVALQHGKGLGVEILKSVVKSKDDGFSV